MTIEEDYKEYNPQSHIELPVLRFPDEDESWRKDAGCNGTDLDFFTGSKNVFAQKEVCSRCHSRLECLNFALRNREDYGIWGGYTAEERRQIRKGTLDVA